MHLICQVTMHQDQGLDHLQLYTMQSSVIIDVINTFDNFSNITFIIDY